MAQIPARSATPTNLIVVTALEAACAPARVVGGICGLAGDGGLVVVYGASAEGRHGLRPAAFLAAVAAAAPWCRVVAVVADADGEVPAGVSTLLVDWITAETIMVVVAPAGGVEAAATGLARHVGLTRHVGLDRRATPPAGQPLDAPRNGRMSDPRRCRRET